MLDYIENLSVNPLLGKEVYVYKGFHIRQIIYKLHRIYYYIEEDRIIIVGIFHTAMDVEKIMKYINEIF